MRQGEADGAEEERERENEKERERIIKDVQEKKIQRKDAKIAWALFNNTWTVHNNMVRLDNNYGKHVESFRVK